VFQVSSAPPHVPPGGHGRAHVFRAAPSFYSYRMLGWFVRMGVFALPLLGGAGAAVFGLGAAGWLRTGVVLGALLVVLYLTIVLLSYVLVRLDYEFRWYVVTDRSLRIR